ncbi:N-6 DNA methylase [Paenibacillus alkaliterrae]|uniref:N-6 DNA methylase n=1 Tax=Paenibacillus alkaliterrae TaxID=320909 RepID=UPI001F3B8E49|nr:N-6 DNA methylase [Paenibacillus alkaliterrae]MCF2941530.1 N-6 DNA methylase [Paenibacillus alkaliterrae]
MTKEKDKSHLYRITRFTPERLSRLSHEIAGYAEAIGGMPQSHSEVFDKRGWLLPFLFAYDALLWGRWNYWMDIMQKGTIAGSGPIPQIEWTDFGTTGALATKKMFDNCLSHHETTIDQFSDWLLWGLAGTDEKPRISEKLNEHFYREFDLFLVLDNPTDYLSQVLCDETGKGYKAGLGYYPTPFQVTRMMVEMTHGDGDKEEKKQQTVMDSCVGCGAMLLPASNYFLRGYGQDISGIAVKLCKIQMYFYAP